MLKFRHTVVHFFSREFYFCHICYWNFILSITSYSNTTPINQNLQCDIW